MSMSRVLQARSDLAHEAKRAKRAPQATPPQALLDARRELAAAKLEAYIRAVVASAPPLTEEQKHQLSTLLRNEKPGS